MAIAEWKVISWRDNTGTAARKAAEHRKYDIPFLRRMSTEQDAFVGYAILLDLRVGCQSLRCARALHGEVLPTWLSLSGSRAAVGDL
jgi:hypothetical protein